jgi:hypothetical protein
MTDAGAVYLDGLGNQRQPVDFSFLVEGVLVHGIGAPVESVDRTVPVNLSWTVPAAGAPPLPAGSEIENLVGLDWTKYSVLAPAPLLTFEAPTAAVILPKSQATDRLLNVAGGRQPAGLRQIVFVPRRRKVTISHCADQVAQSQWPRACRSTASHRTISSSTTARRVTSRIRTTPSI